MARYPLTLFTPGGLMGGGGGDPFLTLHREMNRLFDDVARGGGSAGGAGASQGGAQGGGLMIAPHMDVSETDKEIRLQAELPGVSERDIHVDLNEDLLTIRAEKKQERREERQGVHVSERTFGTFQRSLRLPFQVDPDKVQARFENGVLHVTLPKAQPQERSRRIQVQGSGGAGAGQRAGGSQGETAAIAGHPTPDTTQAGQVGGQGSVAASAPSNAGPGHAT